MQDQLGPTEFFDGAMPAPVTRKAKVLRVVEPAAFTVLVMQFATEPPHDDAADPATMSFPATFELRDVESFQLASGSIQVIYVT